MIHFLASPKLITQVDFSSSNAITQHSDTIDPRNAIRDFENCWISDGMPGAGVILLNSTEMSKFINRFAFLAALRTICQEDVYIQTNCGMMELIFLSWDDRQAFSDHLLSIKQLVFQNNIREKVDKWLREEGFRANHEFRITNFMDKFKVICGEHLSVLLITRFGLPTPAIA